MIQQRNGTKAFTLPTVLITSLVMLTLLLAALQLSTAAANALQTQYYNQLAREAAESGLAMAKKCLENEDYNAAYLGHMLTPSSDCMGDNVSGANPYVVGNASASVRTRFTAKAEELVSSGLYVVTADGFAERTRTSDNAVWKTYKQPLRIELMPGILNAEHISTGAFMTCMIFDQETYCSGINEYGQLGIGKTGPDRDPYQVPMKVDRTGVLNGKKDKLVAAGNNQMCVVTTENEIYCAGLNTEGKLGVGKHGGYSTDKVERVNKPVGMAGDISHIAMGIDHVCVVAGGDIWCWGDNNYGQLGNGNSPNDRNGSPTRPVSRVLNIGSHVDPSLTVTDMHTVPYAYHTCAVAGGKAYCWGRNNRGQLGNNTTSSSATNTPQRVLRADGQPWNEEVSMIRTSFTANGVGSGSLTDDLNTLSGMTRAHTCVLTTSHKMYCWGANSYGQLGDGATSREGVRVGGVRVTDSQTTPKLVGGPLADKQIIQISTSHQQTCALTQEGGTSPKDRQVYCWGSVQYGKVGNGVTPDGVSPVTLPRPVNDHPTDSIADKEITQLFGAINRTCVIADDMPYCWGRNSDGQIGDGTLINRGVPTQASMFRKYRPSIYY